VTKPSTCSYPVHGPTINAFEAAGEEPLSRGFAERAGRTVQSPKNPIMPDLPVLATAFVMVRLQATRQNITESKLNLLLC
jgi:hypothetical protein